MQALSAKAIEIIRIILRGNPDGSWVDIDQLIERLSYKPQKAAVQFSLRALIKRGYIERRGLAPRRGWDRRVLAPTARAFTDFR